MYVLLFDSSEIWKLSCYFFWWLLLFLFSGTISWIGGWISYAHAYEVDTCPSEIGHTWMHFDKQTKKFDWLDGGRDMSWNEPTSLSWRARMTYLAKLHFTCHLGTRAFYIWYSMEAFHNVQNRHSLEKWSSLYFQKFVEGGIFHDLSSYQWWIKSGRGLRVNCEYGNGKLSEDGVTKFNLVSPKDHKRTPLLFAKES